MGKMSLKDEMDFELRHVDGEIETDAVLFALSTCGWCKQTRMYLEMEEISYDYVYVDLTEGEEREKILAVLDKYNPDQSFPTLVLNDGKDVILGFEEEEIEAAVARA